MSHRNDQRPRPRARGLVRRRAGERVAETWFDWCDPETGERLEIVLDVTDAFRERLAAAGFQPAVEPTGERLALGRESGRPGSEAGSAAPAA